MIRPSSRTPRWIPRNIFGGTNFAKLKAMRTLTITGNVSGLAAAVTGTPGQV